VAAPSRACILIVATAIAIAIVTGCGPAEPAGGADDLTLDELRRAEAPPSYFVGEEFEGLPLTRIVGTTETPSFLYGECEAPCSPVQIQHWRIEKRPPSLYDADIPCRRVRSGSVPAAAFETSGGVDVYIGDRTVVVFGESDAEMERAVRALRPVKVGQSRLPEPRIDVSVALRRCTG
jgi:hypothetical protein